MFVSWRLNTPQWSLRRALYNILGCRQINNEIPSFILQRKQSLEAPFWFKSYFTSKLHGNKNIYVTQTPLWDVNLVQAGKMYGNLLLNFHGSRTAGNTYYIWLHRHLAENCYKPIPSNLYLYSLSSCTRDTFIAIAVDNFSCQHGIPISLIIFVTHFPRSKH